uniref:Prealbumin-like fold domain-containing protein n=1 Tax=uncultured marine crenarchaeote E6-3G TaxID=907719 RepID=G9BAM1_9ARCH|nr:hypothetical protein E6-3G_22 [uncultured marine crenarchaeote E6-3G]
MNLMDSTRKSEKYEMKKTGMVIVAILVLASVLAAPFAHAKKGQVTIRVTRSLGKGKREKVEGVQVVLKMGNETIGDEFTDEKGKAVFGELLPNTEYTVVVKGSTGWPFEHKFTTNRNGGAPQQNVIVN